MIPSKMSWARFPFSKSRVVILKICSCGRSIAYEFLEMIIEIMLLANNSRRFLFIRTCLDTYVCYVKYVMDGCTIQTKSTIYHKNYFPQKYCSMAKCSCLHRIVTSKYTCNFYHLSDTSDCLNIEMHLYELWNDFQAAFWFHAPMYYGNTLFIFEYRNYKCDLYIGENISMQQFGYNNSLECHNCLLVY